MTTKSLSSSPTSFATRGGGDLIARAQRGEEAAFRELYERNRRRVYSTCLRMTHNFSDAEDLTQEAFLLVFRKISTFRGEASFSTWLYRLTVNVVLMHLRRKCVQEVSFEEEDASRGEPAGHNFGDDDRHLVGTIDRINLKKALAQLPAGYRTAFILFDQEGYEHHEIAKMMNWSVGNSKSQLHKARRSLRKWLRSRHGNGISAVRPAAASAPGTKKKTALSNKPRPQGIPDFRVHTGTGYQVSNS